MATLSQIRAAIVAKLQAVPDIGRVHNHQPYIKTESKLKDLYVTAGVLKGWHVRRVATRETAPFIGRTIERHRWVIQGFMAFDDTGASELVFDDLVEAIRAAFRTDETLGSVVAGTADEDDSGMQLEDSLPVLFCGVLCHSARLSLITETYH